MMETVLCACVCVRVWSPGTSGTGQVDGQIHILGEVCSSIPPSIHTSRYRAYIQRGGRRKGAGEGSEQGRIKGTGKRHRGAYAR